MVKKLFNLLFVITVLSLTVFVSTVKAETGTITGKVDIAPRRCSKNLLVFLKEVPGEYPPISANMNIKGAVFIPYILPVIVDSEVVFFNNDEKVIHGVCVYKFSKDGLEKLKDTGNLIQSKPCGYFFTDFNSEFPCGVYWISCNIHPEMSAWIVVLQNPYFASTDRHGNYRISGIPEGYYEIIVWIPPDKIKQGKNFVSKRINVRGGEISEINFNY